MAVEDSICDAPAEQLSVSEIATTTNAAILRRTGVSVAPVVEVAWTAVLAAVIDPDAQRDAEMIEGLVASALDARWPEEPRFMARSRTGLRL
jgi:hypothetical protein